MADLLAFDVDALRESLQRASGAPAADAGSWARSALAVAGEARAMLKRCRSADGGSDGASPDRALVDAEAEIARIAAWASAADDALAEAGIDSELIDGVIMEEISALDQFIAATAPKTLAGAAVKLRRMLDSDFGLAVNERRPGDAPALVQILEMLHAIAGAPAHATRPTSTHAAADDAEGPAGT